jgi:hypothetical protein
MLISDRWKANTLKRHRYLRKVYRNKPLYHIIKRIKLTNEGV